MLELIGGIDAFCLSRLVKDQLLVMALVPYGLPNAVRKLKLAAQRTLANELVGSDPKEENRSGLTLDETPPFDLRTRRPENLMSNPSISRHLEVRPAEPAKPGQFDSSWPAS